MKVTSRQIGVASVVALLIGMGTVALSEVLFDRYADQLRATAPANGAPACLFDCPMPGYFSALGTIATVAFGLGVLLALAAWLKRP